MPCEFTLDLCFIRDDAQISLPAMIDRQLHGMFAGKGTWYIDHKVEDGLEIAVAEVKGMGTWESEGELLRYIEETGTDPTQDIWDYLQGYQVQVIPKVDAGCCRLKTR
ncbi:hypothetical protein ABE504_31725 [Paenibacillus oryzisoli]|uniref:hypothetical protein n=1 Tax=Paenibacillus oryzisoli TaxID=1850517 RepID=UPI003D2BE2C2